MVSTNMSRMMERIFWGNKERRLKHRYPVSWNAVIEVRFPDFHEQLYVKVINFSGMGARLYSELVFLNHHHLISKENPPHLILKIFLSEGNFESPVEIKWYQWSVEKNCFEIGVEFRNMINETSMIRDKIISELQSRKSPEH